MAAVKSLSLLQHRAFYLDVVFQNPSLKIAMSGRAVGRCRVGGHRASSEVNLLVKLFEKPVYNAVRRFSCYFVYLYTYIFFFTFTEINVTLKLYFRLSQC